MVHEVKTYVCTKDIDKKIKQILQEKPNEMGSYQFGFYTAIKYLWGELDKIPVADVVEVKRGEWKLHPDGSGTCSCCNRTQKAVWDYDNAQNFCGHCGADMRGDEK